MKIGERDHLGYLHPIEAMLTQVGINVRDPNYIREMHFYLELLRDEIRMTEEFLKGCEEETPMTDYKAECARLQAIIDGWVKFSDEWANNPNRTMPKTFDEWSLWMRGWNALMRVNIDLENELMWLRAARPASKAEATP